MGLASCDREPSDAKYVEKKVFGLVYKHVGCGLIVVLIGPYGCGKRTISRKLVEEGYNKIVPFTTRKPRADEIEGEDFCFISEQEFKKKLDSAALVEYCSVRSKAGIVYYGSERITPEPDKDYVVILRETAVTAYRKTYGEDKCFVVFIDVTYDVRYQRAWNREHGESTPQVFFSINVNQAIREWREFDTAWKNRREKDKVRFSQEKISGLIDCKVDNSKDLSLTMRRFHTALNKHKK